MEHLNLNQFYSFGELQSISILRNEFDWIEEVVFIFDSSYFTINVLADTDELKIDVFDTKYSKKTNPITTDLEPYIGCKMGEIWQCINQSGYFDLVCISFSDIKPNVMILSIASELQIITLPK